MIPLKYDATVRAIKDSSGPEASGSGGNASPLAREAPLFSFTSLCLCLCVASTDVTRSCASFAMKHFNEDQYPVDSTLVVIATELLKASVVSVLHVYKYREHPFMEFDLRLLIPCILYAITNNLFFLALHYITPAVWIVLTQMRLVFILLIYRCAFGCKITTAQYTGAVVLMVGVGLTQMGALTDYRKIFGPAMGISALSSLLGAMAAVSIELILKTGGNSCMWKNTIHLYLGSAMVSVVPALVSTLVYGQRVYNFRGNVSVLATLVAVTVSFGALNGIGVSMVIKKLDNVVRFQLSAVTYIVTAILNNVLFPEKFQLSSWYLISIAMMLYALMLIEQKKFNVCS